MNNPIQYMDEFGTAKIIDIYEPKTGLKGHGLSMILLILITPDL
ncbi:MAG: hypothetical protein IEMM0008_0726 [bacterium]|nr:MAG: hypothetical protein IEMM0008_0726 [bacterium]